jgi:hypothetical protein
VGVQKMITRKEVNGWLADQLAKEGRANIDPDSLSEKERFDLVIRRLLQWKPCKSTK